MATSAFKSTTRRSSLAPGDAGSSNRDGPPRRSRSLSRYSGRFPPPPSEDSEDFTTPRSKFVNKTRGSGFPEISLDDLADEFFGSKELEVEDEEVGTRSIRPGRPSRSTDDGRFLMETESSRRRGRSVSKKGHSGNFDGSRQQRRSVSVARNRADDSEDEMNLYSGEMVHSDRLGRERNAHKGNDLCLRPRRSVSVSRYRGSDLENNNGRSFSKLRSFDNGNFDASLAKKQKSSTQALRRSISQKDLLQSLDNYSSQSSSLTDDEAREDHLNKTGSEKTIQAVYTLEAEHPIGDDDGSGLYEAMRNEVRHAVQEIRTELEKVMLKPERANNDTSLPKGSNNINSIAEIRRNYTNKLEQSEKRKHDLLAELVAEEQRGQELTNIVRELLPAQKQATVIERPSRCRRRSNDRTRMSKRLIEEAERYFEDFLSNVEDTDISSFDGERSDTSSTLGVTAKLREPAVHPVISEAHAILARATSFPADNDGVVLPWLEWETNNEVSPSPCKSKTGLTLTAAPEANGAGDSSLGSWSTGGNESPADSCGMMRNSIGGGSKLMSSSCSTSAADGVRRVVSSFDMDEYLQMQRREDFLFEVFKQRRRIESGSLILCGRAP